MSKATIHNRAQFEFDRGDNVSGTNDFEDREFRGKAQKTTCRYL